MKNTASSEAKRKEQNLKKGARQRDEPLRKTSNQYPKLKTKVMENTTQF